jgi:NADH dehydrogenase FAD-containing subunit
MSSTTAPTVVVVGGSYSAINAIHSLLKQLPSDYKIISVTPSLQFYHNVAAPRALAKNHVFNTDNSDLFNPILPGLQKYPESRFQLIQGFAVAVDPAKNTVTVRPVKDTDTDLGTEERERLTVTYTHLVIATGASSTDNWPFKSLGTRAQTEKAMRETLVKVEAANSIVVSGGGPTGVEFTGELATYWPEKKVTIVYPDHLPLPGLGTRDDVGGTAKKTLRQLGVETVGDTKVVRVVQGEDGRMDVVLSTGETLKADLHIPCYGLVPNTGFLPKDMLDNTGSVRVTKQLNATEHANIWAVGDAAGVKDKKVITAAPMVKTAVTNIVATVYGKGAAAFSEYEDKETPLLVPIGSKFGNGTGLLFGWKTWGVLVWLVKGRHFFVPKAKSAAVGDTVFGG